VCSFKNSRSKHQTINELGLNDNNYATTSEDISNILNNYFNTGDDSLVKELF